jgi:predicted nucleic acid-binding protein
MRNIWVVNASPVITFAKAGHLALLTELADEVLLPDAVVSELLAAALKQSVEE